jgi:peptidyl-prolyl cis-trans isomerase C
MMALALVVAASVTAGGNQEEQADTGESTEQDTTGETTAEGSSADAQESESGSSDNAETAAPEEDASTSDAELTVDAGEPVAVVNGVPIPSERFNNLVQRNEVQMRRQSRGAQISDTQINDMKSNVLEQMINTELLYQAAEDENVSVSDEEVDQQIQQYKNQYGEQGFADALQRSGTTEEELRGDLRKSIAIQELIEQELGSDIEVTETDQRDFYDENPDMFEQPESVTASHILISTQDLEGEEAKQEAKERAEELRTQLEEGADFAELAEEHSEGPSASRGGSLGQFSRGQMVPAFEEAAFALEPGEISDIVETRFGYHIIKVDDKSEAGTTPYEEVKDQIGQYLEQQKRQEAIQSYIDELKDDADIERNVDFG